MHEHYHRKNCNKNRDFVGIQFQLDREGTKERENGERVVGDYFKYFRQKRTINRGTAIIRGNTVDSR